MARSLALLALSSAALAAAKTATTKLFVPMVEEDASLVASVVKADATAATYVLGCPDGFDSNDCGLPTSQTLIEGPSTMSFHYEFDNEGGSYTQDLECDLDIPKDLATCRVTVTQSYDGTTTSSSLEAVNSGLNSIRVPVTVTAGAEKLTAISTAASTDATTTAAPKSSVTGSATKTGSDSAAATESASETASGTTAAESGSSSTASDNAAPAATQNAMIAGVAAVVGAVMML